MPLHRERGAHDRPHLHLVDLGVQDAEPAAARAQHRVDLAQRLDPGAQALVGLVRPRRGRAGTRAAAGRAAGSSPAGPSIASRMPSKSDCWNGSSLSSAARRPASSRARIISRMTGRRSSPKNMCSVRQRPMPCGAELARPAGVLGRVGVRAHAEAAGVVGPRRDGREVVGHLRRHERHRAVDDQAAAAVDRDLVALGHGRPVHGEPAGRRVDVQAPRRRTRTACPSRARRPRRATSCRRGPSARPAPGSGRGCRQGSSPTAPGSRARRPARAPRRCRRRTPPGRPPRRARR